jgi:AcrR family transcriptional regulator
VAIPLAPVTDDGRRRQFIDSADDLFRVHGIAETTLSQVLTSAALTQTDLDDCFDSKNSLIEAVLDQRHDVWIGHVQDSCDEVADARDKILAIFDFLERWFAEDAFPDWILTAGYRELGRSEPWVAAMGIRHLTRFTQLVEGFADEAGLPWHIGARIALLAEGAQVTAAVTRTINPARDARAAAATLIALYEAELGFPDF